MPDIPTIAEQGLPGYDVSVFFGVVAPAGTPADRIETLNAAFRKALSSERIRKTFADQGLKPASDLSPAGLSTFIAQESDQMEGRGRCLRRQTGLNRWRTPPESGYAASPSLARGSGTAPSLRGGPCWAPQWLEARQSCTLCQ